MHFKHIFIISCLIVCCACYTTDKDEYVEGTVKTLSIQDIQSNSATCYGNLFVSASKNYKFQELGICYATKPNPTISDFKQRGVRKNSNSTVLNPSSGEFSANLTGLQENTTYYVRAYTINNLGCFYGNEMNFETTAIYNPTPDPTPDPYIIYDDLTIQCNDISDSKLSWDSAQNMCDKSVIGGYDDWRLPNKKELLWLFAHKEEIGNFNLTQVYVTSSFYWSSDLCHDNMGWGTYYYVIDFNKGVEDAITSVNGAFARCVRKTTF